MKEKIVGFDAREMWLLYENEWSSQNRDTFLLKTDLYKPLSVDTAIWHSVFDSNIENSLERPNKKIGWRHSTWSQLQELEATVTRGQLGFKHWLIAITQLLDDKTSEEIGIDYFPVEPSKVDNQWKFLGYDVAEKVFLSGLMNMGYAPELDNEKEVAQSKYEDSLNEYHLFDDKDSALEFANWSNTRDPGHGPFFVFGVYLVKEVDKNGLQT